MEWQPIETAPKDGRDILIVSPTGIVRSAHWDDNFEFLGTNDNCDNYRGGWTADVVSSWGYQETYEYHPTHWMPLPEPPKN